jgi:hypothetical protein
MATQPVAASRADRAWPALTWLIFLATTAALLATIVLWALVGFDIPPVTFFRSSWIVAMEWIVVVGPAGVGLLLGLRLPGNRIALSLALVGLVIALQTVANALVTDPTFAATDAGRAVAWAGSSLTFPICIFLTVFVVLTFPTGRPISPTWGGVMWLTGFGSLLLLAYQAFAPGILSWYRDYPNPLGVPESSGAWLTVSRYLGLGGIVVALVLAGWSLVIRYRHSDDVGRQQLKWFVYGMALLVVTAVAEITAFVSLPKDSNIGQFTLAGLFIAGALLPITIAVAITRYGLYEIDVLINRTFVFGALTAVLAGLYAAGIRFFQVLFVAVTGEESDGALVLTTLVLATTFTPIKSRLERIAARRLHSPEAPAAAVPADPALRALVADVVREELARRDSR